MKCSFNVKTCRIHRFKSFFASLSLSLSLLGLSPFWIPRIMYVEPPSSPRPPVPAVISRQSHGAGLSGRKISARNWISWSRDTADKGKPPAQRRRKESHRREEGGLGKQIIRPFRAPAILARRRGARNYQLLSGRARLKARESVIANSAGKEFASQVQRT